MIRRSRSRSCAAWWKKPPSSGPAYGGVDLTTGLIIFAATYFLIAVQRLPFLPLNRPAASLLGAVAMVGFGVISLEEAYAAIDLDVLVFLLGLMLIVGYLEVGRLFEWAAEWVVERTVTPTTLLFAVVVGGGLLSAFFVNDTICLVVTPILLTALGRLGVRPLPYLLGLAMGANVGSVLSVTGNPQNMLVGIWSRTSFASFLLHMLPVAAGGLIITYVYLRWSFRRELDQRFGARTDAAPVAADRPLVAKGLIVFAVAVVGWLAGGSLPLVAIASGAVMVAIAQRDPAYAIERVDWDLLLMFASLFVVMRGLQATGAVTWIDQQALALAGVGSEAGMATAVTGALLVLSNLISNVPAVMLWRDVVPTLPNEPLMWRVVAMSSTFAGNFLLIGSVANLIVAERAQERGVTIGFRQYAHVGIPVTLLTLAWGLGSLLVTG